MHQDVDGDPGPIHNKTQSRRLSDGKAAVWMPDNPGATVVTGVTFDLIYNRTLR